MPRIALAVLTAALTAGAVAAVPSPALTGLDVEEDCFPLDPPAAYALPVIDDTTTVVPLHVRVLIDTSETPTIIGLRAGDADDRAEADRQLAELADSVRPIAEGITLAFEPLAIEVQLSYDILTVWDEAPSDLDELIQAGKDQYGGSTPAGVDVVYVATENLIAGVAVGRADCVGGLKSDHHSFAAGKVDRLDERTFSVGVSFDWGANMGTLTMAHEVGHILGAHHHFMNCAESAPGYVESGLMAACTVMVNDLSLAQRTFSTINSAVVRGFAAEYAGG